MSKTNADLFAKLAQDNQKASTTDTNTTSKKRQKGKRSNPDYIQVGAYIKRTTDKSVKRLLIDEDDLDFSGLVEMLLEQWIESKD